MTYRELGERPEQVDGVWILPIGDGRVTQLLVDYAFGLAVGTDTILRFETPFEWFDGKTIHVVEPEEVEQVAPLLALLHQKVLSVTVSDPSHLAVILANGQELHGRAHERYEAWTATTTWGMPEQSSFYVATPSDVAT